MNSIEFLLKNKEYTILYDSDIQGFVKELLQQSIMNKRELLFLIESKTNNKSNELFGFHFHQLITQKDRYIYDKDLYFFQLIQKENQIYYQQYKPNEMNPLTGIILSNNSSDLLSFGMNDFESDINYLSLYSPIQSNSNSFTNFHFNSFNTLNNEIFQLRRRNQSIQYSKFHLFDDFFEIPSSKFNPEFQFILNRLFIIQIHQKIK